jgi:hypothetical protein
LFLAVAGLAAPLLLCRANPRQHTGVLSAGPVAVTSILLGNGLQSIIGSNSDPNNPADPELQERYNHAAVQVGGCGFFHSEGRKDNSPVACVAVCHAWPQHLMPTRMRCMLLKTLALTQLKFGFALQVAFVAGAGRVHVLACALRLSCQQVSGC